MKLGQIVALLGGWSVVSLGAVTYVSRLVAERLFHSWRQREQQELELLRDQLTDSRVTLEAAIHSHSAGQDLAQAKRLEAVQRLWTATLFLRRNLSQPIFISQVLLPEEYDRALAPGGSERGMVASATDDLLNSTMQAVEAIEEDRVLFGDSLWLDFFVYRAVLGRAMHLLLRGIERRHMEDWRSDDGIRQLLGNVLPQERISGLYDSGARTGFLARATDEMELLILRDAARIISGETSSMQSLEIAQKLRAAAAVDKLAAD